MSLTSPID